MDELDELAALEQEFKAEAAAAAPSAGPQTKVISAVAVKPSAAAIPRIHGMGEGGRRLPVSEWAKPEELMSSIRAEMKVPLDMPEFGKQSGSSMLQAAQYAQSLIASAPYGAGGSAPDPEGRAGHEPAPAMEGGPSLSVPPPPPPPPKPITTAAASSSSAAGPGYVPSAIPGGSLPAGKTPGGASLNSGANIHRTIAGQTWVDKTLLDWPDDDFRVFVGDLGPEVNDEVISHAFGHYSSFQKARVVVDQKSHKSKGYAFVSFKDPWDMTKALREMQGKYVGNRPIKVRKSTMAERAVTKDNAPKAFEHALSVQDKGLKRALTKGGAIHKKPTWKTQIHKKKGMPW
jgi:hypothetical protein